MKYLITGGTGFIGKHLCNKLIAEENEVIVLSRSKDKVFKIFKDKVKAINNLDELPNSEKIDVTINLAGEGIANKRWSEEQKKTLMDSRVGTTKELISLFSRLDNKPKIFISASAIGYYGSHSDEILTETSKPNKEFTHELCKKWEQEALNAEDLKIRTCITRLGVVLGKGEGTLKKMEPPFKLGLGGKIGSGEQYFSWVHINDVISAFEHLINNKKLSGIFNLSSPNAITNSNFTKALGTALNRLTIFPMPSFAVKTMFGEMGETLLLNGQRVFPKKLLDSGFKFNFEKIDEALKNIY